MNSIEIRCSHDKMVQVSELKAHPQNRNKHPKEQIERLAKIIQYQGIRSPIKVSNRSGFITAGHGRLEAARLLKMKLLPVNFQDYDSDEQEYADLQSDNAIALWAELDLSGIASDVADFKEFDLDLLGIDGFKLPSLDEAGCDEDELPDDVEAKTKLGDLYLLGEHRLLCGDSTSIEMVEKLMGGAKADITFTSPPYNLGVSAKLRGNTEISKKGNVYKNYDDNQSEDNWLSLISGATEMSLIFSRYAFWNIQPLAGNRTALWTWSHAFSKRFSDIFVWDKQHAQPAAAERVVNSRFELIWCFTSDDKPNRAIRTAPLFRGTIDNVFVSNPQRNNESCDIHGATFPVEFPEWFISRFAPVDGSVLELFAGSGSTLIACEKTNRKCFMMEIDPHYCDVIVARWEKYTNKKAELSGQATA